MKNNYFASKYNGKTFKEALDLSQGLVKKIAFYFKEAGFIVRPYDDTFPFIFSDGSEIRGLDIFCGRSGKAFFVDAKDFPKLLKENATGITIKLYERYKHIQKEFGIKVMIFFIDSEEYEKDPRRRSLNKFKKDGEFIPYGGFMDDFELHHRQNILNSSGQKQVFWKCNKMKDIETFLNETFGNIQEFKEVA